MSINGIGREIPEQIKGGKLIPFKNEETVFPGGIKASKIQKRLTKNHQKKCATLEEAIDKSGLKDGDTISFHHHFRNGDILLNKVLDMIARKKIKNLTITSSSLTDAHDHIEPYILDGTVTKIITSGLRTKLGKLVSEGKLDNPVIFHSHGGRARRIESGDTHINVAFIAAPGLDFLGNINGTDSDTPCGSLGYAMIDAQYADNVIAISDRVLEIPLNRISIPHYLVDFYTTIENIGDPAKIGSGATRLTKNPLDILIAQNTAKIIALSPQFKQGFNFQTGSGGASLAVATFVKEYMKERQIKGNFALGGITSQLVDLLDEGFFNALFDVQSFDKNAALSMKNNPKHIEIDASNYANPFNTKPLVDYLDIVILSALEIDTQFNVNVLTGSNGIIRGASGGHCDTAYGADLTIVVAPSFRSRIPTIVDNVLTVVTPGASIDILVTERGIAVNPLRKDILDWIQPIKKEVPLYSIEEMRNMVYKLTEPPQKIEFTDKVVGLVEYRDGSIIDVIHGVK